MFENYHLRMFLLSFPVYFLNKCPVIFSRVLKKLIADITRDYEYCGIRIRYTRSATKQTHHSPQSQFQCQHLIFTI